MKCRAINAMAGKKHRPFLTQFTIFREDCSTVTTPNLNIYQECMNDPRLNLQGKKAFFCQKSQVVTVNFGYIGTHCHLCHALFGNLKTVGSVSSFRLQLTSVRFTGVWLWQNRFTSAWCHLDEHDLGVNSHFTKQIKGRRALLGKNRVSLT